MRTVNISICFFAALISLSSLSSKAAGLAWLWLVVSGVVAWVKLRDQPARSVALAESSEIATQAAKIWILACLVALVLMLIPTVYWSGPWPERHPQWRLLCAAVGVGFLLRYRAPAGSALQALTSAAALSSLLAYGLVITISSEAAPTNRIPWMAGLSLLSCSLLTLSFGLKDTSLNLRQFWLSASALMLVTVLLSGVRGSFPLLLIWPVTLFFMHRSKPQLWIITWRWLLPLLAVLFAVGLMVIPPSDNPFGRFLAVFQETGAMASDNPVTQDTSSGIRMNLYRSGLEHVLDHPWLGMGPLEAKELIRRTLSAAGGGDFASYIGHFHNDILNPWVEFGVFGLMGYLSYALALLLIAWKVKYWLAEPILPLGIAALVQIHIATGLSNMNFGHNYYPSMLAISLALILFALPSQRRSSHP